jgi:hypothetical protein
MLKKDEDEKKKEKVKADVKKDLDFLNDMLVKFFVEVIDIVKKEGANEITDDRFTRDLVEKGAKSIRNTAEMLFSNYKDEKFEKTLEFLKGVSSAGDIYRWLMNNKDIIEIKSGPEIEKKLREKNIIALKFASSDEAVSYLANLTKNKIIIMKEKR